MPRNHFTRGPLSEVQTAIFYLFTRGLPIKAMAEKLGSTEEQVEDELREVGEKLELSDRLELMLDAYSAKPRAR